MGSRLPKLAPLATLALLLILSAPAAHAQTTTTTLPIEVKPELPEFLKPIVERGIGLLYAIAWIAVIGFGIYGALEWARGDPEKGKKILGGVVAAAIILAILPMFIGWLVGG